MSTMSQRSHLTDSEAWRVVRRLEGGQTQAEVAQAIGVSQSVISRIWNHFLETESASRRPGQYRRRATTPNEDRFLVLTARRHRNMSATLLQQHLRSAIGITVSTQTVRNQLHGVGLYGDEILRPIVVPYVAAIGDDFILMDDNSRPHRANLVEDSLFEEGIVRMEWPACSPDMNPIEHIWDALGRRVAGRQPPPQTLQELERALLEEWNRIPQLVINSLIDSMPQGCSTLLADKNEIAVVPDFHKRILFSDEAHFWLNGYVNKQNCRIWSEANPQVYVETPLHPEKLTVWCALWAGGIIGPYFFKNDEGHNVTVNGDRYRAMITNFFIPKLNNHDVQELWFQQDGATFHTDRATIDLLKDTFSDRLISRFGPVNWPPRSCDLTPLDYFLWGYVKSLVYADRPQTLDHLEDNIRRVIADIRPQMLEKVIEIWTSRLDYIRVSHGSHISEILFKM
ncbi:uncharacterized protein TNCV_4369881 [Trichonephila clavipes]|nr:uncharacterized protein TNCV_4369881 [Trichonephila clavipes]